MKTWFQHDFNASQKDGLSTLIDAGGFEAYGRFWAFMELFYSMQINKDDLCETMRINERTLLKHLQMNKRSLPKLLQLFSETLAIVFQKNSETYAIVYETTVPKSLNYLSRRSSKRRHLEVEVELEVEKEIKEEVESPPQKEKKDIERQEFLDSLKEEIFDSARKLYPGVKGGFEKEFENFKKKNSKWRVLVEKLEPAIKKQIQWRKSAKGMVDFIPSWKNFSTWINKQSWEDELPEIGSVVDNKSNQTSKAEVEGQLALKRYGMTL